MAFGRKRTGSVVCPSCGRLVGVNDEQCYNCGRRNPGLWGFAPYLTRLGDVAFAQMVLAACILLYLITLAYDPSGIQMTSLMGFLAPTNVSLFLFGASGAIPVFAYDRWWTVLSASWLHAGALHILFNMLWVRQLAPAASELYGSSRMFIIYTCSGVVGFTLSSAVGWFMPFLPAAFGGSRLTVGASAAIFGLLGALVYYGRRTGSSHIGEQAKFWAIIVFIYGLIMPGVDNWAHFGGFLGGYTVSRWLDPLQPERLDHLIVAFLCALLSLASIFASVLAGLSLLPG